MEEFTDKMRLLLIHFICGTDLNEIKAMIDNVKMLHADKFDEEFVEQILKRRTELEQ
jgi:23S rRNA U2552 (ribose-2'-O)-methylase RlmE/FtsJ